MKKPTKVFSFKDVPPNQPIPGDRLDAQFADHAAAITDTQTALDDIRRSDGALNSGIVTEDSLAPDLVNKLAGDIKKAALTDVSGVLSTSAAAAATAQASATSASHSASTAQVAATDAADAASRASMLQGDAQLAADEASVLAFSARVKASDASNAANHAEDSQNRAHMSAEMAMAWAEYLPDTIPPRYFPDNAVTGDHWSARWWANKAAGAFGQLTSLYLGAHPTLAAALANAQPPIAVGAIYYNTTESKPYIYDGAAWTPFWSPQRAITTTLHYRATANQSEFRVSTPDLFNNSFTFTFADPEPVDVHLNGVRLLPAPPAPATGGDYTVDVRNNKIVLSQPIPINSTVTIDILTPASKFANGTVNFRALLDIDLDPATRVPGRIDGTRVDFPLARADGQPLTMGAAQELLVSVDGVIQHAGADYNAVGSRLTFTTAPSADSKVWALWMEPGSGGGGGRGVTPPTAPDDTYRLKYAWKPGTGAEWSDDRGFTSVADQTARLALTDTVQIVPGSVVFERNSRDLYVYSPRTTPGNPADPANWTLDLPGHPNDNVLRALEYDPDRPGKMAWEDNRDDPETVDTEADLSNRAVLPLSHLAVGKLVYVRDTSTLWECLIDGTAGTATNTIKDWRELGGSVIAVARAGNLPDPTVDTIPDGQIFLVRLDGAGVPINRFIVWDATRPATNPGGAPGDFVSINGKSFVFNRVADVETADSEIGDIRTTTELLHKELKVFDDNGAWTTIYSEDDVRKWIAAGNLFQGTAQDTGHGSVGALDLSALTAQPALTINDAGHYYIYVGAAGHVLAANELGGQPSNIDGARLNVGDWLLVANTGTQATPNMRWTHIPGDLLSKSRGDGLYGLNPWVAGAYETGSVVVYNGSVYKASTPVLTTDIAPGSGPLASVTPALPGTNIAAWAALPAAPTPGQTIVSQSAFTIPAGDPSFPNMVVAAGDQFIWTGNAAFDGTTVEGWTASNGWVRIPAASAVTGGFNSQIQSGPWRRVDINAGVKTVPTDTRLPASAANGTIYLVLSSARAGGKQALYSWDSASSQWQPLGGGGIPLNLTGGRKLINYGTPIGTVITFAGRTLPAGYLLCDGSTFPAATYPELNTVLGGNVLPDLRNQFIRGANTPADVSFTKHQSTTGRPRVGFTGNTNSTGAHSHRLNLKATDGTQNLIDWANPAAAGKDGNHWYGSGGSTTSDGAHTHTLTIDGGGDAETAPDHVILMYLIKADDVTVKGI